MCPPVTPPPLSEIGQYWSDEQIFGLLAEYTPESRLPTDVITDSNPYDCLPCNLPDGIWYLVHPNQKRESIYGFWKAKNEPHMVVSNSMITGWRTTLEYFDGHAPHGQITDWLMQEYSVKRKVLCGKDKPEVSRLLCRVFLCSGHSSKSEMNGKATIGSKQITSVSSIDPNINTFGKESRSESQATWASKVGAVAKPGDEKSNSSPPILSEQECFINGDFLEMDDLDSNFTSSQNSSCPSNLSDDCFDAVAMMQEIEENENKTNQTNQSSSKYSLSSSVRSNDIILQLSDSVMSRRIEHIDGPQTVSTIPEGPISDTSIASSSTSSTSRKTSVPRLRKKPSSGRIKKLKFYFCFTPF